LNRVGAEACTHRSFLEESDRRRQGTGPQQQRKILRRLDRKIAADDTAAAKDRFPDNGGGDDFVVQHNRKDTADVVPRRIGEALRPGRVEGETDDRLAILERALGINQIIATQENPLVDDVAAGVAVAFSLGCRQNLRPRRDITGVWKDPFLNEPECQDGSCSNDRLEFLRILNAGNLEQNPIIAMITGS